MEYRRLGKSGLKVSALSLGSWVTFGNQMMYEWLRDMLLSEEGQERLQKVRVLSGVADELGTNMARLALAWCLKNPNVSTVITGASRVSQVEDNMKAVDLVDQLTDDVMEKIEAILDNKPEQTQF